MTTVLQSVRESLGSDLVSYAELRQICATSIPDDIQLRDAVRSTLKHLLRSGVEIGNAKARGDDYVAFTAWGGTTEQRIERAFKEVELQAQPADSDFAFWLCLAENIDAREEPIDGAKNQNPQAEQDAT
jgi:hypothetical protein